MKRCRNFFKLIITAVICFMSGLFSKKEGQTAVNVCGVQVNDHAGQAMNSEKVIYGVFVRGQASDCYENSTSHSLGCRCRENRRNGTAYFDTG